MAEFVVNTTQLDSCSTRMAALQRELDAVAVKLGAMQLGSVLRIKASAALIGKVGDCKWAAANQSDDLGKLSAALSEIAELYARCEKNLADPKTETQAASGSSSGGSSADEGNFAEWFKDVLDFLDITGEGCGTASVLWGLIRMFDGTGEEISNGLKNIFSGASEILNQLDENAGELWEMLAGWTKSGVTSWDDAFNKFIEGHVISTNNNWMKNTSAICKWAGYALSVLASGFQNYDEFDGDLSNARFWGETAVQSVVDIGLTIGASIAAAALLPETAAVLVVGLAAAGTVWAANTVCEWITGENIAENVADVVCDGVEAVVNVVENVADGIADAAEAAWSGICDWVSSW